MTRAEWRSRQDFHEMAEALDIRTNQVLAAHWKPETQTWTVVWSEDYEGPVADTPAKASTLVRGTDEILVVLRTSEVGTLGEILGADGLA